MQLYQQAWKSSVYNMKIKEEDYSLNTSKSKDSFNSKKFKRKELN